MITASIPTLNLLAGDRVAVPTIDALAELFAAVVDGKVVLVAAQPSLDLIKLGPDLGQHCPNPVTGGQSDISAAA